MNIQAIKLGAALLAGAFLAAACGGSGGSGSTNTPPPPDDTGGITGTGVATAIGPISGFGSVIVNGVTYDTSSASFTLDGEDSVEGDFEVGQYIVVLGTIENATSGTANSVVFDDAVEGPVSSVDELASTFVVLGQTVTVGAGTSIDDSCPATLEGLLGVPAVEVSGPVTAAGTISATRVECKAVLEELEVTGVVSSHDAGTMTFQINALVVDYSGAAIDNFPTAGMINNGDPVEAKGNSLNASDELVATRVEYKGLQIGDDEGDHVEVEGFITRYVSATDFDVSGIPVTTNGSTEYEGGTAGDLGLNLKVEVEGDFDAGGTLVATKVEIKPATNVRVTGRIDSINGATIHILNIPVTTDGVTTRFEDKTDADVDPLRVMDLNVDDYVEVRGQEIPAGSGEIAALLVERDDPRPETELRGFVEAGGVNRPDLTVLGVTITANGATEYFDANDQPMLADDFWAAVAEGSLVDAKGVETGLMSLLAEELELE